jgi:hypothetical protein
MRSLWRLLLALCLLSAPASAWAAGRGDVYSVSGVEVDVTSADAAKARDLGFAQAQSLAFDRLVKRLTAPEDLARISAPKLAPEALDRLVDGVDIQEEHRSDVRYLARVAVNFDPAGVRKALQDAGLRVFDTRTAALLVAPVAAPGTDPNLAAAWRQAWEQGGFAEGLVPLPVAPQTLVGGPDWSQAQPAAAAAGATSVLYAAARVSGGQLAVDLVEIGANNFRRERGQLSTPLPPGDAAIAATFMALARAVDERIQNEWKQSLEAGGGRPQRLIATASFQTMAGWLQVLRGLTQANATLVSDIEVQAIARNGAVVAFSHLGTMDQLKAELGRYGVQIEETAGGAILRPAGRT